MADLKSPKLIWMKGLLFLVIGVLASGLLVAHSPSWQTLLLLLISIWGFCRFYYFTFYVIQHYVDPSYRFAGLLAFVQYMVRRRR